jgi:hypothetical protein
LAGSSEQCGSEHHWTVWENWTHRAYIMNHSSGLWEAPSRPSFGSGTIDGGGAGEMAPPP